MCNAKMIAVIGLVVSVLPVLADERDVATLRYIVGEQSKQRVDCTISFSVKSAGFKLGGEIPERISSVVTYRPNSILISKNQLTGIPNAYKVQSKRILSFDDFSLSWPFGVDDTEEPIDDNQHFEFQTQRVLITDDFVIWWPNIKEPTVTVHLKSDYPDGFDGLTRLYTGVHPSKLAFMVNNSSTLAELLERESPYPSLWTVETTKDAEGNPTLYTVSWAMDKDKGPRVKYFIDPTQGFCVVGSEMDNRSHDEYKTVTTKELTNLDGTWVVTKYAEETTTSAGKFASRTMKFSKFEKNDGEDMTLADLELPAKVTARKMEPASNGGKESHRQKDELELRGSKLVKYDAGSKIIYEHALE